MSTQVEDLVLLRVDEECARLQAEVRFVPVKREQVSGRQMGGLHVTEAAKGWLCRRASGGLDGWGREWIHFFC
jgi:hypothetical protein